MHKELEVMKPRSKGLKRCSASWQACILNLDGFTDVGKSSR